MIFSIVFGCTLLFAIARTFIIQNTKLPSQYFQLQYNPSIDNIHAAVQQVYANVNTASNTAHFWNENIPDNIQGNVLELSQIIKSRLGSNLRYVSSMTELYFSSKSNSNSDQQYVRTHVDGPFFLCPVYRVLVTIDGNLNIDTHLYDHGHLKFNLKKYDILAFDYNCTFHRIDVNDNETDKTPRIILKLQDVQHRPLFEVCEKLHCEFGRSTRDIFDTNKPQLKLSGILSTAGLLYYTFTYVILILTSLVFLWFVFHHANIIATTYLAVFTIIEALLLIYTIHFAFLNREVCNK
jgi:hypothetical protein